MYQHTFSVLLYYFVKCNHSNFAPTAVVAMVDHVVIVVAILFIRSHLIMHRTIGLTDFYRTISDGLMG